MVIPAAKMDRRVSGFILMNVRPLPIFSNQLGQCCSRHKHDFLSAVRERAVGEVMDLGEYHCLLEVCVSWQQK